jgi:DNA-binding SARP family transcriptional activator/ABC-type oligopeptide transport system substrate-binding subunit
VEFLVLGPLEVRDGERIIPLGGAKQRAALAMLLLHSNEVVSRDHLIDGLWGDSPPASAAHTIEAYISRLRKALHCDGAAERLLTRSPGYLLRVDEGELDVQRLEALIDLGRRALAADDPQAATTALRQALALFRGAPLEDLGHVPFAQTDVRVLDDLRLAALEWRIDADLALGRHADLIGELQTLVAKHPRRERFWAQLMLAYYRSGQQGEALATYDRARRRLVEELGIDPGRSLQQLHQRILHQHPALEPNDPGVAAVDTESIEQAIPVDHPLAGSVRGAPGMTRPSFREWRRRTVIAAVAAAIVVVASAAALVVTAVRGSDGNSAPDAYSAGIAIIDAKTGKPAAFIPRATVNQGYYTYVGGHVWAYAGDPDLFVEIDPKSGRVLKRFSPTTAVAAYAVEGHDLWEVGDTTLARIDTNLGTEVARYQLPRDPQQPSGAATGIAVGDGSLWVSRAGLNEVLRIDPRTGHVVRHYSGVPSPAIIAVADGSAWTVSHFSSATVVDLTSGAVSRVNMPPGTMQWVATGGGYGWFSDEAKGVVYKIDRSGHVAATYHTGEGASAMAYADGVLWVANVDAGTATGIDAVTGATRTLRFDHPTGVIAAGGGLVVVMLAPGRTPQDRIDALRGRVAKFLVQPYQLAGNDPDRDSTWLAFQVEYATCAKLLNYPDLAGPRGAQLQPEIAASMPTVSADRRTYTFTIRSGYRFSPPSNQPVTADTFHYSIERALSPTNGTQAPDPASISDIAGESAYRAGNADHITGLKSKGDTLTIRLVSPSPDFLQRLALPFFCPVPIGTPAGQQDAGASISAAGGQTTIPSAGPYYIADFNTGEYLILKRNPNYNGPRPHALDAIALREGIDPGQALGRVQNGSWDGVMNLYDPLLDPTGPIAHEWGPESQAAADGDQRYFPVPTPGVEALAFNAGRPPFSDPTVRRAAALALDRSALAGSTVIVNRIGSFTIPELPSAQLLPPNQPGFQTDHQPYPLASADLARARALMRGRHLTARLAIASNCDACRQSAQTIKRQLAAIGITIDTKAVSDPQAAIRRPDARFDLVETSTVQDFADPAAFLTTMLDHDIPHSWLPASVQSDIAAPHPLGGQDRIAAAATLARRLATTDVPATAFAYQVNGQFFSPRLGCRIFPPFGYGVDLAALCLPHS